MDKFKRYILITGGAGFIGSHLVRHFVNKYPEYQIVNLDKLTYAGNLLNLTEIESYPNYQFVKGDICDIKLLEEIFEKHKIDSVLHCAAESHVDRSISDPLTFVRTNLLGTTALLSTAKKYWQHSQDSSHRFHHISTDEVYGSLGAEGYFTEQTPYDPKSPYSASKAGSDHLVRAFGHTYGMDIVITNCSNNYGPYQFPEKLIPLCIHNAVNSKVLPVYGEGINIRDWLYVEDHVEALDMAFHSGKKGETYNIGGENEWKNIDLVHLLCDLVDAKTERKPSTSRELIRFVKDRAGHDYRYAIDASKINEELGWSPKNTFEVGLSKTIDWYSENETWLSKLTSGDYLHYYEKQYGGNR
ncbi:dTDP-glucose 4,6-dehydratase [soil metagenome]